MTDERPVLGRDSCDGCGHVVDVVLEETLVLGPDGPLDAIQAVCAECSHSFAWLVVGPAPAIDAAAEALTPDERARSVIVNIRPA